MSYFVKPFLHFFPFNDRDLAFYEILGDFLAVKKRVGQKSVIR